MFRYAFASLPALATGRGWQSRYKKNCIRHASTPQPGEIVFNTISYRSSETVQRSGYFQSSVSYFKLQIMLMQVFHWSRPYDSRIGYKSRVVGKSVRNAESVMKSTTGPYSYRQDVMSIPTSHRVGHVFCMASLRTTTTSPKPLTDKLDHRQAVKTNRQAGSMFPTVLIVFVGRDRELGSISHYINPPPL